MLHCVNVWRMGANLCHALCAMCICEPCLWPTSPGQRVGRGGVDGVDGGGVGRPVRCGAGPPLLRPAAGPPRAGGQGPAWGGGGWERIQLDAGQDTVCGRVLLTGGLTWPWQQAKFNL